jgi:hypothetical protein
MPAMTERWDQQLPEYAKPVHTEGGEAVMSTPSWYDKHDKGDGESAVVTVFVDARTWPPKLVEHAMRTATATRLPDGRWACVAKREGTWALYWFASIAAMTPSHVEPLPFATVPPKPPADDDDDPPDDDGPVEVLHAFAGKLIAIPFEGVAQVRDGDGPWHEHAALKAKRYAAARSVAIGGKPHFEWIGALYDADLRSVDALDCTDLWSAGGRVLALHDGEQLVEFGAELQPELAGHDVTDITRGPRDTLILTLSRDDDRGSTSERVIYDPVARTVATLTDELIGEYPKFLACTNDGGLVLHVDRDHTLVHVPAERLAELSSIPASELVAPPRIELPALDALGAASRPTVATCSDAIAMILNRDLRIHSVDAPKQVWEINSAGIVGVAAFGERIAALDTSGQLHEYALDGQPINVRSVIANPRSLLAVDDRWLAIGANRVVLVDDKRTSAIEIAGALAAAADSDTGEVVIASEGRRLACWSPSDTRDLPPPIEQIVALAPLGDRKFACAGTRNLYLLDLAMPELVRLSERPRRPFLAGTGIGRLAFCPTASSVQVCDLHGTQLTNVSKGRVHYSSYSAPDNAEVTVHGLAFMDDGRLVIQLDEGRGNIVEPETGSALKLDPQPGDPRSRWIFFTGAGILVAD